MSEESTQISEEQAAEIVRQFAESKSNVHTFFTNIIKAQDTTKIGNLEKEELGTPRLPFRSMKELELFCTDIYVDEGWANWFRKLAEIQTSSSLSKEGFLIRQSVTQKKELADTTPRTRKKNSGWFKSKRQPSEEDERR